MREKSPAFFRNNSKRDIKKIAAAKAREVSFEVTLKL